MSNLQKNNLSSELKTKTYEKIIITDDSDDTDNSIKSVKPNSLFNNINKKIVKSKNVNLNKNSAKSKIIIDKQNHKKLLINKTKEILENSYCEYQKSLENYYLEVLELLNLIFSDDAKSIMKLKLKKITLNEDIFDKYNSIIKKYKLKKDLFVKENFSINEIHDFNEIVLITKIITNNLLFKIGLKLDIKKFKETKKLKIVYVNNAI